MGECSLRVTSVALGQVDWLEAQSMGNIEVQWEKYAGLRSVRLALNEGIDGCV